MNENADMKTRTALFLTLTLAWGAMDCAFAEEARERDAKEARQLLEFSQRTGSLPNNVAIRVIAHLSGNGPDGEETTFKEAWEFTSNEVHRIVWRCENLEMVYKRDDSRPFNSIVLCKELTDGKAFEIREKKAKGDELMFAGTEFTMGLRSIEILRKEEPILELCECCVAAGFRGADSIAFAALYERLAAHGREAFKALEKATEPKDPDPE